MATIKEDYVSFETAKLLKEKGFDSDEVGCLGGFYSERCYESGHGIITQSGQEVGIVYDDLRNCDLDYDEYLRPTQAMAMKWLREVHNVFISIIYNKDGVFIADVKSPVSGIDCWVDNKHNCWFKYEEAAEEAIKFCLERLI